MVGVVDNQEPRGVFNVYLWQGACHNVNMVIKLLFLQLPKVRTGTGGSDFRNKNATGGAIEA